MSFLLRHALKRSNFARRAPPSSVSFGLSFAYRMDMKPFFKLLLFAIALQTSLSPSFASSHVNDTLSPDEALKELKDGNDRFTKGKLKSCGDAKSNRAHLIEGQAPDAIVLSCSDSRLPPEQVFDQGLGKIFAVRVAGNVLNENAIASIEYALTQLGSRLIVIMGHESCGAIKAAIETPAGKDAGSPSLNDLLAGIRQNLGATRSTENFLREPVKKNVSSVAEDLSRRSKIVHEGLVSGKVRIEEAIYDLNSGRVEFWESTSLNKISASE